MEQTRQYPSPYCEGRLKLSESELEQIQLFLETVHQTLHIPLVLEESNPEYPIVLAENHYGITPKDQENLIELIQKKYQLDKKKVKLKILITSHENLAHVGLSRSLITQIIISTATH